MNEAPVFKVDLSNCDREPIHISGAVQPHGVLLVLAPDSLDILQLSRNTDAWFGLSWQELLGSNASRLFGAETLRRLREITTRDEPRIINPLRATTVGGRVLSASVHRASEGVLVELEDAAVDEGPAFREFQTRARLGLARLQHAVGVVDMCVEAARELRGLTGFDRVMVYRFDRHDNGHVIAESKRDELESYLDLHYPASDIPAQARRLYTLNHLRAIVDVNYAPVPIEPAVSPVTSSPLDLSFSILRSVSPIHVEYLKNMGISASLSVSLVVGGRLWGLFICHHYAPRLVPYEVRVTCEHFSQLLSWQVAAQERADRLEQRSLGDERLRGLLEQLTAHMDLHEGISKGSAEFLGLVEAEGGALVHAGKIMAFGLTPQPEQLAEIVPWLRERTVDGPLYTEHLPSLLPAASAFVTTAAGLLAVRLDPMGETYLLWFRPEVVQTVHWAGDPNKTASLKDGAPRLSPRGSFALWKETVQGQSLPWQAWQVDVAVDAGHAVASVALKHLAVLAALNRELTATTDALRAANLAKDEFLAILSHELRTPLSAMLGWVRLLRGGRLEPERAAHGLEVVERNAQAQAKLIEDLLDVSRIITGKMRLDVLAVNLLDVIHAAVESVRHGVEAKQITLATVLDPRAAIVMGDAARLQQVLWNLLTNAVKFTPKAGRVSVHLTRTESVADITITDNGEGIAPEFLPHVFERFRQSESGSARKHQGLGLGLAIVRHLVELHGGTVSVHSDGAGRGATFRIVLPLAPVARTNGPATPRPSSAPMQLGGVRVLVVEDEPDARELLVMELSQCGVEARSVDNAREGLRLIQELRPDVLISDIGMPEMDGYALIAAVRQLPPASGGQTPAIALTAFGSSQDRTRAFLAGFDAHLPKPVEPDELAAVLLNLTGRRKGPAPQKA
ncbi:MAG TPA: ATP-binding protein [Polyangiaceae bacterium]|nr:ATP-binding protein [Polyangiaceae bacterium]